MLVPEKKTFNWTYVFLIIFAINMIAIVVSRLIIGASFDMLALAGFGLISVVVASLTCLGYFGMKLYTLIFMTANFIAVINMLYVAIVNKNDGWTDLTSIFMYLFVLVIGLIIALVIQGGKWLMEYYKKESVLKKKHKKS